MEFIGQISGITSRNKKTITYESTIYEGLLYEYQIHQMYKKTASLRCAGCRSKISNGSEPEFKPDYFSAKIDFESNTVKFKRDPDMEPHVCVRLHPDFMKGKQLIY